MQNVSVKSRKIYESTFNCGVKHYLSLVCRQYMYGKEIYILKSILTYGFNDNKRVYKYVYHSFNDALYALRLNIHLLTIDNINREIAAPF